jgi:hypothetical protein
MNAPQAAETGPVNPSPEETQSALFAQMVLQQSSLAMMLLGKTPHPESGQVVRDLDAAKLFIDQLEMLEVKTKGNLSPEEAALLKQSLMSLHLAFVEAVDSPAPPAGAAPAAEPKTPAPQAAGAPAEEEHRKKFTKKY